MQVAAGILTSRGGMTSHAAVVTRGMGKCCVVGAGDLAVREKNGQMRVGKQVVLVADWISVDGTTVRVIKAKLNPLSAPPDNSELQTIMKWLHPLVPPRG